MFLKWIHRERETSIYHQIVIIMGEKSLKYGVIFFCFSKEKKSQYLKAAVKCDEIFEVFFYSDDTVVKVKN